MVQKSQIDTLLKQSSLPDDAKSVVSDLVAGFMETLDLCEKQAKDLEKKEAELKQLRASSREVELQKVASIDVLEKTAGDIADKLIRQSLIEPSSRQDMVEAIKASPEKLANVVDNIFIHLTPLPSDGSGVSPPHQKKEASSDEEIIPADDPMMEILRKGAA